MFSLIISAVALISLTPAMLVSFRRRPEKDLLFWITILFAIFAIFVPVVVNQSGGWKTDISSALWATILTCLLLQSIVSVLYSEVWKLSSLLIPYLFILGLLAIAGRNVQGEPMIYDTPTSWMIAHIIFSLFTYGLINLAAISAIAASIKSRGLKQKKHTALGDRLPPVFVSENLTKTFLIYCEILLIGGLLTGLSSVYLSTGSIVIIDHKTVFSFSVFVVIALLLFTNWQFGTRGRILTRVVLAAYLLLTLGYPGVKIISFFVRH